MTTPRSSAGIGVRNWHCRISLAKHRSAAPRHQMITARNKKPSTKKPLGEKFMFPKGSGDWALVKLLKPFRGAYEYGSVATLRCHIGYQRVTWRVILGNGFRWRRCLLVHMNSPLNKMSQKKTQTLKFCHWDCGFGVDLSFKCSFVSWNWLLYCNGPCERLLDVSGWKFVIISYETTGDERRVYWGEKFSFTTRDSRPCCTLW